MFRTTKNGGGVGKWSMLDKNLTVFTKFVSLLVNFWLIDHFFWILVQILLLLMDFYQIIWFLWIKIKRLGPEFGFLSASLTYLACRPRRVPRSKKSRTWTSFLDDLKAYEVYPHIMPGHWTLDNSFYDDFFQFLVKLRPK